MPKKGHSHKKDSSSHSVKKSSEHAPKKFKCCSARYITKKDVNFNGYVISKPGLYKLCHSIVFKPSADGLSAITISTSDVHLDLNGYYLSQDSASTKVNNLGVLIMSGVDRVIIENGSIDNFSAASIWVENSCKDLLFQDLNLTNSGRDVASYGPLDMQDSFAGTSKFNGGLGLAGEASKYIENIIIRRVASNGHHFDLAASPVPVTTAGFFGAFTKRLLMEDCSSFNVTSLERVARGFTFQTNDDVEVHRCQAENFTTGEGGTCINFGGCNRIRMIQCTGSGLTYTGLGPRKAHRQKGAAGIGAPDSFDVLFQECSVSNLKNLVGGVIWGIHARRSQRVVFDGCVVENLEGNSNETLAVMTDPIGGTNVIAGDKVPMRVHGFHVSSGTAASVLRDDLMTVMKNCKAVNVRNLGGPAYGFSIEPFYNGSTNYSGDAATVPSNVLFKDCEAMSTSGVFTNAPGTGFGLALIDNDPATSAGFRVNSGTKCNLDNCDANSNINGVVYSDFNSKSPSGAVRNSRADYNSDTGFKVIPASNIATVSLSRCDAAGNVTQNWTPVLNAYDNNF